MTNQQGALQYADRDHTDLGSYYMRHVSAMTGEALHSKSAIAAELAHRDREIDRLQAENANLNAGYAAARLEIQSLQARIKAMAEEHADELTVAHLDGRMRAAQPVTAQQPGAATWALPDADRDYMRKVVAVAVTMLFDGYKEDVTRVFSTGELSEFVTITAAMGGERVEDIYRRAWDLLSLPVRASHGQAPAQAASVEVADAMADSQYLAGVSAGWNAANADDPNAALRKLHESRAGYLKPLSAARTPADSVTAPAGGQRCRTIGRQTQ